MNVVGIIHARGGSKRIPLKNIRLLAGKPLVTYIIGAARRAKKIDRVIVSTDHEDIIRISRGAGAEVPFVRPQDLSEDVPSELVTQHAVKYLEEVERYPVDVAVTFQPTTPFCSPEDIDGCVDLLLSSDDVDSVFSAQGISERPEWMFFHNEEGLAQNLLSKAITGDLGVSQKLPSLYIPNGGIYVTRRKALFEQNAIIGRRSKMWIMPKERSVDIDEPVDFLIAEVMAKALGFGESGQG